MNQLFDILEEDISPLGAEHFVDLFNRLVRAEGSRIGLFPVDIHTSLRITVPDAGVDARVFDNSHVSEWLPLGTSVWQCKSGVDHDPVKLRDEFDKPGVQQVLAAGGSYRVVVSDDLGNIQRQHRIRVLEDCCHAKGVPTERVKLLAADQVAAWAREFPAIRLLDYFNRPTLGGLVRWSTWAAQSRFQNPFHPDLAASAIVDTISKQISEPSGIVHLSLVTPSGVGSTRLALEIFRPTSDGTADTENCLSERVLYAEEPEGVPAELFQWLESTNSSLILVVDDCDEDATAKLARQVERTHGRVRLVTITKTQEPQGSDQNKSEVFIVGGLDEGAMWQGVQAAVPTLPSTAVTYVTRAASGNIRLALALAGAIDQKARKNPEIISPRTLTEHVEVNKAVKTFLVTDPTDYRVMQAISVLDRIGWDGELQGEGRAVTKLVGLTDWDDVKARAKFLTSRGLIAKQGRYRRVVPQFLAVKLAAEVWDEHGTKVISILDGLHSIPAANSLLQRLRDLGGDPRIGQLVDDLLNEADLFPDAESLNDEWRAKMFSLLAEANPTAGLRALQRVLGALPVDDPRKFDKVWHRVGRRMIHNVQAGLKRFSRGRRIRWVHVGQSALQQLWGRVSSFDLRRFDKGRRQIVWLLEKLVWLPETFIGASHLLLLLAEAENESWANNAGGIWVGIFGTRLGNTAVPALERHALIMEALDNGNVERQLLAVRAISRVFAIQEIGSVQGETQGGRVAPPRWTPNTWDDDRRVRLSGLTLLDRALASEHENVRQAAWEVLLDHARELAALDLAGELADRLEVRLPSEFDARRRVLQVLDGVLDFELERLTPEQIARLQALCATLAGSSYGERLRLWTGDITHRGRRNPDESINDWGARQAREREEMSASLADEGMLRPDLLRAEWDWLGGASFTYFFAKRLGELDAERRFWGDIEALVRMNRGHALATGYLDGQAVAGRDWRTEVIDRWTEQSDMALAVFELTWRGGSDDTDALRLIGLVERGWIAGARLGVFTMSTLPQRVSTDVFLSVVRALLGDPSDGATSNSALLLSQRLQYHPEDRDVLAPMVWEVLERPKALVGHDAYQTMDVVSPYIAVDPIRVARAVMKLFEGENPPLLRESPQIHLLEEATACDPQGVWAEVAPWLTELQKGEGNVALYYCLQSWYGQCVGAEVLVPWAQNNVPKGPHLVAAITAVMAAPSHLAAEGESSEKALQPSPLDTLVRELLIQFPDNDAVSAVLAASFTSGTFWGNFSHRLRAHLDIASGWLDDPAPAVRSWTRKLTDSLQKQIDAVVVQEEEELI